LKKLIEIINNLLNRGNPRTIKLKKNIAGSFLIKCIALVLALIKVPVLISYLDPEKYGVWLTIASIVMWVNNFDLGLGLGLRNRLAESIARNDMVSGRRLVSTAYISLTVLMSGLLIILIPVVFMLNWNDVLNVHSIDNNDLALSVLIVLILFTVRFVLDLISVILKADQRTALADLYLPLSGLISLIIILIVRIYVKDSLLLAVIIIASPSVFILLFANLYLFKTQYFKLRPSLKYFDKKKLRDIYSLGLKFFFGQLVALVLFSSQNLILAQVVNPTEVTVYNIAKQYFDLPLIFFMIILNPYWSAITDAFAREDYQWIKLIMKKINLISLIYSLSLIFMLLISNFAFKVWIGNTALVPFQLSIIFTIYNIFVIILSPYNYFLNGVGKLNLGILIGIFKLIVFLPVAIMATKEWGGVGLLLSLTIISVLPNLILNIIQYHRIINHKAFGVWNK
jgi:O-antigen/teichoic acid export membrane protein